MEPKHTEHAQRKGQKYAGGHLPYNPDLIPLARKLRKSATQTERMLWKALHDAPFRVLRQRPIDNYIVDFYIAEARLVIELDGGQHFRASGMKSDAKRTRDLEELGLYVMRFTNLDVKHNITGVVTQIWEYVKEHGTRSNLEA